MTKLESGLDRGVAACELCALSITGAASAEPPTAHPRDWGSLAVYPCRPVVVTGMESGFSPTCVQILLYHLLSRRFKFMSGKRKIKKPDQLYEEKLILGFGGEMFIKHLAQG